MNNKRIRILGEGEKRRRGYGSGEDQMETSSLQKFGGALVTRMVVNPFMTGCQGGC